MQSLASYILQRYMYKVISTAYREGYVLAIHYVCTFVSFLMCFQVSLCGVSTLASLILTPEPVKIYTTAIMLYIAYNCKLES